MKKASLLAIVALFSLATMLMAEDWTFSFMVYNGDRSDSMELTLGVDSRASDGFDSMLDIPFLAPPSGFYAYFALNDPDFPDINMLSTDIRSARESEVTWQGSFGGPAGEDARLITWSVDDLPLPPSKSWGNLYIGAASPGDPVDEWTDMAEADSFLVDPGQNFHFEFRAAGAEDSYPPEVRNWEPAPEQAGVEPTTGIEFDIVDDVSGVDLENTTVWVQEEDITELGEFTAIVGGYHFTYTPEEAFASSETVTVAVESQDLADPVHTMERVEITFYIRGELPEDVFPPRVLFWQPADGSEDNSPATVVRARVTDTGSGVDPESITMEVNGMDVTESLVITPTGVRPGEFDVLYDYPGDYSANSRIEVVLNMADNEGNPALDTLVFWTGEPEVEPAWFADFFVWSYAEGSDTVRMRLTLGTNAAATNGFDPDLDLALPLAPPTGPYAYFPLSDPEYSSISMLTKDMRPISTGAVVWNIHLERPGSNVGVTWTTEVLTGGGDYLIGAADEGEVPGEWVDMRTTNSFEFEPGQIVWVKYYSGAEDTSSPYLLGSEPENGASGVSTAADIYVEITDEGTGVDMETVTFLFGGVDVTDELSFTPIPGGFGITYDPGMLDAFTTYHISINASDYAENTANITVSFTTGSGVEIPDWMSEITVFTISGASGDTAFDGLTFGVDDDATEGFDSGLDVPIPLAPPSGFYAFFPLADEDYPFYTMLDVDVKSADALTNDWTIETDRLYTAGGSEHGVAWDSGDIPLIPNYSVEIGTAAPGEEPTNWISMVENNSISFTDGENIYIRASQFRPETYTISGVITLEGATDYSGTEVSIPDLGMTQNTDEAGNYSFTEIAPGSYDITYHHEGYMDTTVTVEVEDSDVDVSFAMELITYTVSGVVSIEDLPSGEWGGTVVIIGEHSFVTQTDGSYELTGIMPGEHLLTAEHEGYAAVETTIVVESDMEVDLTIAAVYYTISGTVSLEGEGDLAGTEVELVGIESTTTDAEGYYEFTNVESGLANLVFTRPGYVTVDTTFLVEGDVTVDVTLSLSPVDISGTVELAGVTDDLSGSSVSIDAAGYEPVITGPSGHYAFEELEQGEYTITVTHEYFASAETTVTANTDMVVDFELLHLDGVTDLEATFTELMRPLDPEDILTVELSWTAPEVPGLTIDHYEIYRGTSPTEMEHYDDAADDATSYSDISVEDGVTYYYYLVVVYEEGNSPDSDIAEVTPVIAADVNMVLVYDFDNGATPCDGGTIGAAEALTDVLDDLGISYTLSDQDEDLTGYELTDYEAVIVVTGVYDAVSTMIPDASLTKLIDYATVSHGPIYVEGADFAKDYSEGSATAQEFFGLFGTSFVNDGLDESDGNVEYLTANFSIFARYLTWEYAYHTLADRFVDEIAPVGTRAQVLWTDEEGVARGVLNRTGRYTAIFSSCYTGGIVEGTAPLTRLRYLAQILEEMGIPTTGIADNIKKVPTSIALEQNYPNPFNPVTVINYQLPQPADVTLEVVNLTGRRVALLEDGYKNQGYYSVSWNASDFSTGVYFYKLTVDNKVFTRKMFLMK